MREIRTSGSTRGRRAADLICYSSSYSTVEVGQAIHSPAPHDFLHMTSKSQKDARETLLTCLFFKPLPAR